MYTHTFTHCKTVVLLKWVKKDFPCPWDITNVVLYLRVFLDRHFY